MREIKLRAWDNQEMLYEWFTIIYDGGFITPRTLCRGANAVMQFTGLTDKNGKEIYEGDIIEQADTKHEVIFHKGCFCWAFGVNEYHIFNEKM
jgi:hypothetical protein